MRLVIEVDDNDAGSLLERVLSRTSKKLPSREDMIKAAAVSLYAEGIEEFSAADIYKKVVELFGSGVNQSSISLCVIGCAPNHSSYKHGTTNASFLAYICRGTYTLSDDAIRELLNGGDKSEKPI